MKKLLMSLMLTPMMALAETEVVDGIEWTYSISGGSATIGSLEYHTPAISCEIEGDVVVPSNLGGCPVKRVGAYAFHECKHLSSIVIQHGVTYIGQCAFPYHSCSSLTIPSSVVELGSQALFGYNGPLMVTRVRIDDKDRLERLINNNLDSSWTHDLLRIIFRIIPDGEGAVDDPWLIGAKNPKEVVAWLDNAGKLIVTGSGNVCDGISFGEREVLESILSAEVREGVTNVGGFMFEGCSRLKSITIAKSVTSIGGYAFCGCVNLMKISIPKGVSSIGTHVFDQCRTLAAIDVDPQNLFYESINGALFRKGLDYVWLVCCPCGKSTVTIPYMKGSSFYWIDEESFPGWPLKTIYVGKGQASAVKGCIIGLLGSYDDAGVMYVEGPEPVENFVVVILDANGGDAKPEVIRKNKGEKYGNLPEVTRDGYFFDGWFTAATGGSRVTASTSVSGDVTLYAHWSKKAICTITLDARGGDMEWVPRTVEEGDAVGELPVAEQENREFLGWYTAAIGGTRVNAETVVTKNVTFYAHWRRTDSSADYELIVGSKVNLDAGLVGYSTKMLPKGLSLNAKTGKITGAAKAITASDGSAVTFTKKGAEDVSLIFVVRAEEMSVGCEGLSVGTLPAGVQGSATGEIELQIDSETGTKSVSVSKLPAGMKYDTKKGVITGAPTKTGNYEVSVTVTTKAGNKKTVKIPVSVAAMPMMAVGTFNGFVSVGEDNFGTFTLTTTDAGKLTAKVITAAGNASFSGTCWDAVEKGVYRATLTTKKGETLTLTLDSTAAWDANQLSGEFTTVAVPPRTYAVSAQRNAFGKTWYFAATGDETTGWKLTYTEDTKGASLTVTLKADGSISIAGKLPNGTDTKGKAVTIKVSASGYANVGGLKDGAILADFAPVLTVNKVKIALAIKTNLWFDRKNGHENGVGEVRFVK